MLGKNVEPSGQEKSVVPRSGDDSKKISSAPPPLTETKMVRLGKATKPSKSITPADETSPSVNIWTDGRISKLIDAMANGKIFEINPTIDISTQSGYSYFEVDQLIESGTDGSRPFLETLAKADVLNKKPFEKIHIDPDGS